MKARTQGIQSGFGARLKGIALAQGGVLENLACALLAFIMANSFLFNEMAPFGVAFTGSVRRKNNIAALAGAVLGYTFSYQSAQNIKYIIAVVLLSSARWLLEDSRLVRFQAAAVPVLTALCLFAAGAAIGALDGLSPHDLVLSLSEAALAGGSTFFMMRTMALAHQRESLLALSHSDLSCLIITFAIMMMAMSAFTVAGLSVGRVTAVVVILISARYGHEAAGAVAGVTAGAAMGLLSGGLSFLAAAYGFGGLLAGMFSAFGSFGIAVIFVVVNGVVSLILGGQGQVLPALYEVFAASLIFMLLPARWTDRLLLVRRGQTAAVTATAKEILLGKLRFAADALADLAQTTRQVSEKLLAIGETDVSAVCSRGVELACRSCKKRADCWGSEFSASMDGMNHFSALLRRKGKVGEDDFTGRLEAECIRKGELAQAITAQYSLLAQRMGSRRKATQIRGVVTDQFEGMSMMLDALAGELGEIYEVDDRKNRGVADIFLRHQAELTGACSYQNQYGRLTVEVDLPAFRVARLPLAELAAELGELCETTFASPVVRQSESNAKLVFSERADLTAEYGQFQIAYGGGRLCGDCAEFFTDQSGRALALLSDGMGSGGKAAVDSAMTVSLLVKLISSGFAYDAALKLVNSALLVKSDEESLSTIDLVSVDLYTGETEFLKAGAAPSFVLRSNTVGKVESMSLPAGILRGVEFERSAMTLRAGDIILLISDGVILTGIDWLAPQIKLSKELPAQEMAKEIAQVASSRRANGHDDDITVAVIKLGKGD